MENNSGAGDGVIDRLARYGADAGTRILLHYVTLRCSLIDSFVAYYWKSVSFLEGIYLVSCMSSSTL